MNKYRPGTIVQVHAHFERDGRPVDPQLVRLFVDGPGPKCGVGRQDHSWIYDQGPEIVREDVGHYWAEILTDNTGHYFYTWHTDPVCRPMPRRFLVAENDE